jgi:hypothetical protein
MFPVPQSNHLCRPSLNISIQPRFTTLQLNLSLIATPLVKKLTLERPFPPNNCRSSFRDTVASLDNSNSQRMPYTWERYELQKRKKSFDFIVFWLGAGILRWNRRHGVIVASVEIYGSFAVFIGCRHLDGRRWRGGGYLMDLLVLLEKKGRWVLKLRDLRLGVIERS